MAALGIKRPPHRWLLVGPERAGTALHVDPLETAAWNTLVSGAKRWVLLPPTTEPCRLQPRCTTFSKEAEGCMPEDAVDSAVHWLHFCYPALDLVDGECYDFVQL